jgi:hypothetical protein
MANPITSFADRFFGRGKYAVTIPAMDGPLLPNSLLDTASEVAQVSEPDNLAAADGRLYFSSGRTVYELTTEPGGYTSVQEFSSDVTALAARDGGAMVASLANGSVATWRKGTEPQIFDGLSKLRLVCLTAIAFGKGDDVFLCNGSISNGPKAWAKDLMERNSSGSVWCLNTATRECTEVAKGLAYPSGLLVRDDQLIVSEAWKHRLLSIDIKGKSAIKTLLPDLPAYPSRIVQGAAGNGYWLCLFAPRSQLIEFVLRERAYRKRMMAEAAPEYWIAPALRSGVSFLEPLQGGGVKRMGILKPWAPSRSYGLVVRLDANFHVVESFHSRADGVRHGVTSVEPMGPRIVVTSKGGNAILALSTQGTKESSHAASH